MLKYCNKKCCCLKINGYVEDGIKIIDNVRKFKAGVILHNTYEDKILIVQSRGNLWGFPKGSFEEGETFKSCAIRELHEETGIKIDNEQLNKYYKVNDQVAYFYVKYDKKQTLNIQTTKFNDANGIGWVSVDCLMELMRDDDTFNLNYHAKRCLTKFFKIKFN